jgi:HSP20 family protein
MFLTSFRTASPAYRSASAFERVLDEALQLSFAPSPHERLSLVNLYATEDAVTLSVQLPGVDAGSVSCTVLNDRVSITANRQSPVPATPKASSPQDLPAPTSEVVWHRRERSDEAVSRTIVLPYPVESEHTQASLHDGVLTVTLRRREADRPRRITVSAA